MQAADLFRRGVIPAEIARQLGVSHQIVSEWRKAWHQGGRAALRSAGRVGPHPKLTQAQLTRVAKALAKGAEANGYATDVWTLPRVAEVIQRVTGVSYHTVLAAVGPSDLGAQRPDASAPPPLCLEAAVHRWCCGLRA